MKQEMKLSRTENAAQRWHITSLSMPSPYVKELGGRSVYICLQKLYLSLCMYVNVCVCKCFHMLSY